jgi:hypothetical protein
MNIKGLPLVVYVHKTVHEFNIATLATFNQNFTVETGLHDGAVNTPAPYVGDLGFESQLRDLLS